LAWQPSAWYVGGEAGTYSAWVRRLDATATTAWTWQEPDASAQGTGGELGPDPCLDRGEHEPQAGVDRRS